MAPLLVEIVGAAGSGKTTLLKALQKSGQPIEAVFSFRRPTYALPFGQAIASTLPFLLAQRIRGRTYSKKAMMWMIRLKAAHTILQQQSSQQQPKVIILDQGPVYMLMRLVEFGAEQGHDEQLARWLGKSIQDWATLLDLVILLDAPERILVERVFGRDKEHFAKDKSAADAHTILARHRQLYRQVVKQLTDSSQTHLLDFDTSKNSVEQLLTEIATVLQQPSPIESSVLPGTRQVLGQ